MSMSLSDTKRKLLQRYMQSSAAAGPPSAALTRARGIQMSADPAPLSHAQEHMWQRETSTPGIPLLYNECIALRMPGLLDVRDFERGLAEVVRRHELWRTNYEVRGGQLLQAVQPAAKDLRLPLLDLRTSPSIVRREEAKQAMRELVREPFDLQAGRLFRARLVRIDDFE